MITTMNAINTAHLRTSLLRVPALIASGMLLLSGVYQATASVIVNGATKDSPYDAGTGPIIGNTSIGSMEITDGSKVTSSGNGFLGYESAGNGTVTINGADSSWTHAGEIFVARNGTGSITLKNSAQFTSTKGNIGHNASGKGTVSVESNAKWTVSSDVLWVGNNGNGTLNISSGGKVEVKTSSYIGYATGSTGSVTVAGNGSTWATTVNLIVGRNGTGKLSITDGGQVSNVIGYIGSNTTGNSVSVSGAGSVWTNTSSLSVGSGNTLTIRDSGLVKVGGGSSLNVGTGSLIQLDGGYLAWSGDNVAALKALIQGSKVQLSDGSGNWIADTDLSHFSITYVSLGSADTGALTGGHYADLGGYTILSLAAIPEPAVHATVVGGILLVAAGFWAKKRRARA